MSQTIIDSAPTGSPNGAATGEKAVESPELGRLAALEHRFEQSAIRRDGWTLFIFVFSAIAPLAAILAVSFGSRAIDESKRNSNPSARGDTSATAAPATAMVHVSEFVIEPKDVTVAEGGTLEVTNSGAVPHNLGVKGTTLVTK